MLRITSARHNSNLLHSSFSLFLIYSFILSFFAPLAVRQVQATPNVGRESAPKAAAPKAASPAPSQTNGSKRGHRKGELIVRFREGVSEADKTSLIEYQGAQRQKRFRGGSHIEKLRLPNGKNADTLAAELRQNPAIEFAEPNYLITRDDLTPDDPRFNEQWALRNTGANGGQSGADIGASLAWETTTGSTSTTIAVIDSGIDFTHPDLQNNQWTNTAETANGQDDDNNGLIDDLHGYDYVAQNGQSTDEQGHGTRMAGIIAAQGNNTEGISGVMWRASLMSLRVLDSTGTGDIASAIEAIDYAIAKGAKVINCSWGTEEESLALRDAIQRAGNAGILVVCSAGNSGQNLDTTPYYPASYNLNNLIAVASTDNTDQLASWSNWSSSAVTIAAPGVSVLSTKKGGGYEEVTGSSASAPLVAGMAGLILTVRPLLNAQYTKSMIMQGARPVAALFGKVSTGGVVSVSGGLSVLSTIPAGEGEIDTSTGSGNENGNGTPGNGNNNGTPGNGTGTNTSSPNAPTPTLGAPGPNLPNLDQARVLNPPSPRAPAPIRSNQCQDPPCTCTSGDCEPVNIPVSRPAANPTSAQPNQAIQFDGSASTAPAGRTIVSYSWDFGDGTSAVTGVNPTHTFATSGSYTVRLTVTDSANMSGLDSVTVRIATQTSAGGNKTPYDFDGDSKTDISVWRVGSGYWHIIRSAINTPLATNHGVNGDIAVPGDYDGDGKADYAVWRPSNQAWYVMKSSNGTVIQQVWGAAGDIPVAGDYDGDRKTDYAVFRPSQNAWYILKSTDAALLSYQWGSGGDVIVPGDYDGDGKTDPAVWRPGNSTWYVLKSSNGGMLSQAWGNADGDFAVPGDYDGDGKSDYAVWRPSNATWYILRSSDSTTISSQFGVSSDVPVPGDYDGDGKTDLAVWRGSDAYWYILRSSNQTMWTVQWGNQSLGDDPVPAVNVRRANGPVEPSPGTNNASYVTGSLPSAITMTAGQQYALSVKMNNTGTSTWTAAQLYRLGVVNDTNNTWGIQRVAVPTDIGPNTEATFNFTVTAPLTTGTYNFQWRMTRDGVEWFGDTATSTITVVAGSPTSTATTPARLDPSNRVGGAGVDLYSRNYNWSIPLVSLPGRAGMDLGLSLSYNSLVWTKEGTSITFNADKGFPAPGFRLGFPVIQGPYFNEQAGSNYLLMIMPSGSRVELRQKGTDIYESVDSSYIQVVNYSGVLIATTTDGTQLKYSLNNGEYKCIEVKDRNGNFITATYSTQGRLLSITDTLARVVSFNYDSYQNLISISQDWSGISHDWVTFGYGDPLQIQTNFNGLTVNGPQNGTTIPVLRQVGLADGSYYKFDYSPWGQVYRITEYAQDNTALNSVLYNLPADGRLLDDCPRFSEKRVWAQNWNDWQEAVTTYSETQNFTLTMPDGTSHTGALLEVTAPDGTVYKEFYHSAGWDEGLNLLTETFVNGIKERSSVTTWTQDNLAVPYLFNPRVTESNVYDKEGKRRRSRTEYTLYGLPSDTYEYDADAITVMRRIHIDYNLDAVYTSRHIIGLVRAQYLYGIDQTDGREKLVSKIDRRYDQEPFTSTQTITPVQHDSINYDSSFVQGRANLSSVRRWNVHAPDDAIQAVEVRSSYNTAGAVVSTRDPLGHQATISFADSFLDGVNRNSFAYPTTITDQAGYSSTLQYRYDLGVIAKTTRPSSGTGGGVTYVVQTTQYDAAGRVERVINSNNNAYTRWVYSTNHMTVQSFSSINQLADESYSITVYDGASRVRATAQEHPGGTGGYAGQYIFYDVLGQAIKQSNQTEMNSEWLPVNPDAVEGGTGWGAWRWTLQSYDWKGRPLVTTNVDGTTKEITYNGCGCAGGEVITISDEGTLQKEGALQNNIVRRRRRITHDILGRVHKSEVLNWDGSIHSTVSRLYNGRDQIVKEFQLEAASGISQETLSTYDGHGRLATTHTPEQQQNRATSYAYNDDDTIKSITDARGATKHFTYDNRHLIKKIDYSAPVSVTGSASAEFEHDAAGNRTLMKDGLGRTDYTYNHLSQLISEKREFTGVGTYTFNYSYNLIGLLTNITDPERTDASVGYSYDSIGRLSAVTGGGYAGVTKYARGFQYRAWGGLRHVDYGNDGDSRYLNITYNQRQQIERYTVAGVNAAGPYKLIDTQYRYTTDTDPAHYDNDGRVKYVQDQAPQFDRGYRYDNTGRLKLALTGSEARAGGGGGVQPDGPYRQTYGFDMWGHPTNRTSLNWGVETESMSASYINNRRNDWQYDAEGNPLQQNELQNTYDAAGRAVSVIQSTPRGRNFPNGVTVLQEYDGDGQRAKHTEGNIVTYYVRSSVLKGEVIYEIAKTPSTNIWQKRRSYVYAEGKLLAIRDHGANGDQQKIEWVHHNPATGSQRRSNANGATGPGTETDPLGVDFGTAPPPEEPVYTEPVQDIVFPRFGDALNLSTGCAIDGAPVSCDIVMGALERGDVEEDYPVMVFGRVSVDGEVVPNETGFVGGNLSSSQFGNAGSFTSTLPVTVFREDGRITDVFYDHLTFNFIADPQKKQPRTKRGRGVDKTKLPQKAPEQLKPVPKPLKDVKQIEGLMEERLKYGSCADKVAQLINQVAEMTGIEASDTDVMKIFNRLTSQTAGGGVVLNVVASRVNDFVPPAARISGAVPGGSGLSWVFGQVSNPQRITTIFLRTVHDIPYNTSRVSYQYAITGIHEALHHAPKDPLKMYSESQLDQAALALDSTVGSFDGYLIKHCIPAEFR